MEISEKRLYAALGLVLLLGVLLSIANAHHIKSQGEGFPIFVYGVAFVSFAVGGAVVLIFQWKIHQYQLQKVMKILPRDEGKIMGILIKKKEIEQNKLVTLTGLTKVKVSRLLSNLEQRGVVEKKQSGYTNLIILKI